MKPLFALLTLVLTFGIAAESFAITLTGSNGRKVEFAGIKDATPKGITAQLTAESDLIGLTWDKFDLASLKEENPQIYAAYLTAKEGETVNLNLGTYMVKTEETKEKPPPGGNRQYRGWTHTKIGSVNYLLQMPLSSSPQGILLVATGDHGRAFQSVAYWDRGTGPFADLVNKHKLAILTYEFFINEDGDPREIPDFVYAEKGSGEKLFTAIDSMATSLGKPELSTLPIAVFATERVGAAFGYNLIQYKPERIAAGVVAKGGFYTAEPTEASAKVPVLLARGEYSNQTEIWNTEDTAQKALASAAALKPNWTAAVEFRGSGEMTLEAQYFGTKYLEEMLTARLIERKPKPEPAETDEDEEGGAAEKESKTEEGVEAEKEEGEEEQEEDLLAELDRSAGLVGNLETHELMNLDDPDAPLGENETFIPNNEVGKFWKKFSTGELVAPRPKPLN